ncbi:MAG: hypothetical protein ACI83W_002728 [Marinoscillum sp.]|jgi:hypothetical protein
MKISADPILGLSSKEAVRFIDIQQKSTANKDLSTSSKPNQLKPLKRQKNIREEAVATMMSNVLTSSLSEDMSEICKSFSSSRLTAKFKSIAECEKGMDDARPLSISKHGHSLSGFEFNREAKYEDIFGAKYFIKVGSRKGQVIIHFPAFVPEHTFVKPEGATNFKINARLVAISDFQFNQDLNGYEALHEEHHGKYGSFESPMLPILKIPTEPMTTQVSLNEKDLPEEIGLFLVMSVSFFHYDHRSFEHLSEHSGMTIKQVY